MKLKFSFDAGEGQVPVWAIVQAMCIPAAQIYMVGSLLIVENAAVMFSLELDQIGNQFKMRLGMLGA